LRPIIHFLTFSTIFLPDAFTTARGLSTWLHGVRMPKIQSVLVLQYEDLMSSLLLFVQRIASLYGWTIPEASHSEILETCSFAFMKKA
jgi:hypothetical protein